LHAAANTNPQLTDIDVAIAVDVLLSAATKG
jgi:hypothetical protein